MSDNLRADILNDIWVKVRRDSLFETARLGDFLLFSFLLFGFIDFYLDNVYCEFLEKNFPNYNERMVTVPVSLYIIFCFNLLS